MTTLRYTVSFPAPETHYVEVEASVPVRGGEVVDLVLPVWTPGSYKIRDYSRHLEAVRAESATGESLPVEKRAKNRWRVTAGRASRVRVLYRVYARELTVRTNHVDLDFALLNGAATFLTIADGAEMPHEVDVALPSRWQRVFTALEPSSVGGPNRFLAPDYDTLVDSPFYLGNPMVHSFEAGNCTHLLVNEGEGGLWPGAQSAADAQRIAATTIRFWEAAPYPRYLFVNLIGEGFGGLEHRASSVLMCDRWRCRQREGYLDWLGLVAHELFHAWNGKRLRPVELGPFDYERERYTGSLWVVEGLTSYYDDLLVRRAGLASEQEYLEQLSKAIRDVQTTPGRAVRSVEESSFDSWIKLYQPDENIVNTSVSYYRKGAAIAWILDALVRTSTGDQAGLDEVMREAYRRHSGERGYTGEEIRGVFEDVAGESLGEVVDRLVGATGELPYHEAMATFGLRFATPDGERPEKPWLGAEAVVVDGRLLLKPVRRGSAAQLAGLDEGDEIIGFDGFRVPPRRLADRLAGYRPGETIEVMVARRNRLFRVELTLDAKPTGKEWALEPDPDATPEAAARRTSWLAPDE